MPNKLIDTFLYDKDLKKIEFPEDEQDEQINSIKKLIFEYIVVLALEWYYKNEKNRNPNYEFDGTTNVINANKFLFYPFFFSTANGHSKALFHLTGEYVKSPLSPISKDLISDKFGKKEGDEFIYKFDRIEVSTSKTEVKNPDIKKIKELIENTEIKTGLSFKDLNVEKDDNSKKTPLTEAIAQSREALEAQSRNYFLNYDLEHFRNFGKAFLNVTQSENGGMDYDETKENRFFISIQ